MTYCVGISVDAGLVFASDSRTNAGSDQVSCYGKMHTLGIPGERQFVILSAGNLATTQAVVSTLRQALHTERPNLMSAATMFDAATLVGDAVRTVIHHHSTSQFAQGSVDFSCSFLVGGQIGEHGFEQLVGGNIADDPESLLVGMPGEGARRQFFRQQVERGVFQSVVAPDQRDRSPFKKLVFSHLFPPKSTDLRFIG